MTAKIVEGTFALVSSGNVTQSWMVDGDDIQERANQALGEYYGGHATIFERGVKGFGLHVSGPYMVELYVSREMAQAAIDRARSASGVG